MRHRCCFLHRDGALYVFAVALMPPAGRYPTWSTYEVPVDKFWRAS